MVELDVKAFLGLLDRLVGAAGELQNSPGSGLVPREILAADIVERALAPHIVAGTIECARMYADGYEARPSLVLRIKGHTPEPIAFVGAHLDVVPASREVEGWARDPFELSLGDGGILYGRGVTDCLGHVALLTQLLSQLCASGMKPERSLTVVLIANEEETPVPGVGLEYVVERGLLDPLVDGPLYWLDSADFGPTVGTGGMAAWELEVQGVGGHSGMSHNCVNALEVAMAACGRLAAGFVQAFPPHPDESRWGFNVSSTLKPTVIDAPNRHIAKIPGAVTVRGDIRLTPFYELDEAVDWAVEYVAELGRSILAGDLPPGFPRTMTGDGRRCSLVLHSRGRRLEGIACRLDSPAHAALETAIRAERGAAQPYSMTGSLPLVRGLQRRGFDVQITGFGQSRYYHAVDEQGLLADFEDGFRVLWRLLEPYQ